MRRNSNYSFSTMHIISLIIFLLSSTATLAKSDAGETNHATLINAGKQIAFNKKKGNCLACHAMKGGESAGSIGPALVSMRARFSNKNKLKEQIWDARINNPHTIMPPFGKHRILSEKEIEQLVEYLYTL